MLKATFLSLGLLLAVTAAPVAAEARPQGRSHVAPARDRRGDHYRPRHPGQWHQGHRYRKHHHWGPQHRRWAPRDARHRRHDRWNGASRRHDRRGRR
jgi:hypothetical protein